MGPSEHKISSAVAKTLQASLVGVIGAASFLGLSQGSARAAYLPAISFNGTPNTETLLGGPYALGYHFTTDFDRKVKAIGIYKPSPAEPSVGEHSVGIWDFSGTPDLRWSKNFTASDSCELSTYFCWYETLDGPELSMNVDYVVASTWGDGAFVAKLLPSDISLVDGFRLNESANTLPGVIPSLTVDFVSNPGYAPDETSPGFDKGFITVNLSFDTYTPAQTPAPLPLIGAAAAFGWSRKIRRRISTIN